MSMTTSTVMQIEIIII